MALRMMLVVLVASLGLDLPSWAEGGAEACAGGEGRSAGAVEAVTVSDEAFAAVVDEMVSAFAAGPEQGGAEAEAVADAPGEEEEDLYPGLAYALNREAEGLSGSIARTTRAAVVAAPPRQEEMAVMPPAPGDEEDELVGLLPQPRTLSPEDEEMISPWLADELAVMPPAPEEEQSEPAVLPGPISRGERLVKAMQLTGAAVHAWVTLLQQAPAVVADRP